MFERVIADLTAQFSLMPAWLTVTLIVAAAAFVALLLHRLMYSLLERRLKRAKRFAWLLILQKSRGPSALAVTLFVAVAVLRLMPLEADLAQTLIRILQITVIALLTWIATRMTDIFGAVYLRRFHKESTDDFLARKQVTQIRILKRAAATLITVVGIAAALMTFESVRQYGVSLFASAGVAGLAIGLAARPLLSSMIAGIQIALTQPIRLQDVVIVEGEYGTVEEITSTYVVVKLWDWRRMVIPLSYFIEKPFQNWTRDSAALIGAVTFNVDYSADVGRIRTKLNEIVESHPLWDKKVVNLQVTDATERSIELRALVSAGSAATLWDLRCAVREQLIAFVREEMARALPRSRQQVVETKPVAIRAADAGVKISAMPQHAAE
ncbi:MAG: mechanosensitive ion channel family protein [Pseudomonadota bacterium]